MPSAFFFQSRILSSNRLESTNLMAMERLRSGNAMHGDVIMATYQTSGRGQAGNTWYSTEGNNVLVSFICKDIDLEPERLPVLNMLVSIAVHHVIANFFPVGTAIKWPNDILVNDKKIAGILIETTLSGGMVKHAILGIGININEPYFPSSLPFACSFHSITGQYYDIDMVFKMLFEQLDTTLSRLKQVDFIELQKSYEPLMFGIGVKRYFRTPETKFEGVIEGINHHGQLLIETPQGPLTFNNKEIVFDLSGH